MMRAQGRPLAAAILLLAAACGGDSLGRTGPPPAEPPPPDQPGTGQNGPGVVQVDSFYSVALGVSKHYLVYLPPSYATASTTRYPVVYFLHGSQGNERSWLDDLHVNAILDSMATEGEPEMIAVLVDGDDGFYHDWVVSADYTSCLNHGTFFGTPASTYCVKHMAYGTYVANDLVTTIDARYRTKADVHHRGIAGLSMGGFGAVYLALARPDVFSAAASLSGTQFSLMNIGVYPNNHQATTLAALPRSQETSYKNRFGTDIANWRAHDPLSIVTADVNASRTVPALWFVVGSSDSKVLNDNEVFHAALLDLGVNHVYSEQSGGHSVPFWAAHEREAAEWLAGQLAS